MATKESSLTNPKRAIARREQEASAPASGGKDTPADNSKFFKARDHSKDKEGLKKALKKRGY